MDKFTIALEESLEKQWEYFRENTSYGRLSEDMQRHLKRAFFAGIAQAVIMIMGRSKVQSPEEVFSSIQDQLEIYWQQEQAEIAERTAKKAKGN